MVPRDTAKLPSRLSQCCALLLLVLASCTSCTRQDYRLRADDEVYGVIREKADRAPWDVPFRPLEPPPQSRLFDPYNPDRPPMPPDDVAAHEYMHLTDGRANYRHWHSQGDAPWIETPDWQQYLEASDDGTLQLNPQYAIELGLLHSRQYQFELERLYLTALALTLERFQFDIQSFLRSRTQFDHIGTGGTPNESNTLTTSSEAGFRRTFTSGGQLLVDFANALVWEFTGTNSQRTLSVLSVSMVQPLLRGAFREVQMEPLTQAERDVLYSARQFARFRKIFYFNLVSIDDGYLQLLLQVQAIRNLKANLASLEQNLLAHEALARAGIVSGVQVDQVFQSYQVGRLQLIRSENFFQTTLDAYKIQMGLPPRMSVEIDDSLLDAFQLSDPALDEMSADVEAMLAQFRAFDEPPAVAELAEGYDGLREASTRFETLLTNLDEEYERWKTHHSQRTVPVDERQRNREELMQQRIGERLVEIRLEAAKVREGIASAIADSHQQTPAESWEAVQRWSRRLLMIVQDSSVIQTQIRVQLIELPPLDFQQDEAIAIALENRLDLMNQRAEVVDAWRRITVAADALQSDLDVFGNAEIVTEPGTNNPLKFSADDSHYRVGIEFDGPLNRLAERNIYRAQLIEYQRARRAFMATEDSIVQAVRFELRQLEAEKLNFEITRERLIVAARQVEEARLQLLEPGLAGDSSKTQDVLNGLNSLLGAKDALIETWARYHSTRLLLLLDLELLELDPRGLVLNDDPDSVAAEYIPPPVISDPAGPDGP